MSDMHIQQVLHQMRVLSAQMEGQSPAVQSTPQTPGSDFGDLLAKAIDGVNEAQKTSTELKQSYELGDKSVELIDVMLASQKSSLSFEAMVQVRNRLVNAYQDVMNMPI